MDGELSAGEDSSDLISEKLPLPSAVQSVGAMFGLLLNPAVALEVLFTPSWPRFVGSLLLLYVVVPWQASIHLLPAHEIGEIFFLLNREFGVTLENYEVAADFFRSFGLLVSVLVVSLIHTLLLRFQGLRFPLVDGLALATYSFFPVFLAFVVIILATVLSADIGNWITASLIPAFAWGGYVWYRASYLLTEVSERALVLTGVLLVLIPLLLLVGILTVPHLEMMQLWDGGSAAPESYLLDSIEASQNKGL